MAGNVSHVGLVRIINLKYIIMEELFYRNWRKEKGITIDGYKLSDRQLIEMLIDFRKQIEALSQHDVSGRSELLAFKKWVDKNTTTALNNGIILAIENYQKANSH